MRTTSLLLSIILLVSFFNQLTQGQETAVGIGASFATPNKNLDPGAGFYGHVDIIIPQISLVFRTEGGGYDSRTTSDPTEETDLVQGDYSLRWIEESVLIFNPSSWDAQPFAGLGIGYYFFDYQHSDEFTQLLLLQGLKATENISNSIGLHAKAGLNIFVMSPILLKLEVKYVYLKPDFKLEIFDNSDERVALEEKKINLSTLFINAGIIVNLF